MKTKALYSFRKLAEKITGICIENGIKSNDKEADINGDVAIRWGRESLKSVYSMIYYSGSRELSKKEGIEEEQSRLRELIRRIDAEIEPRESDEYPNNMPDEILENGDPYDVDSLRERKKEVLEQIQRLENAKQEDDFVVNNEFLAGATYLIMIVYRLNTGLKSKIVQYVYPDPYVSHKEYGYTVLQYKLRFLNEKVYPFIEGKVLDLDDSSKLREFYKLVDKYSKEYDEKIKRELEQGIRDLEYFDKTIETLKKKMMEVPTGFLGGHYPGHLWENLKKAEKDIDFLLDWLQLI